VGNIFMRSGLVILALVAGNNHLSAATFSVGMSATVAGVCSLGPVNAVNGFANTAGTSYIATTANGLAVAKTANLNLPYNCSSTGVAFTLTSANTGITKPGTPPTGQTNKIHYTAKIIEGSFIRVTLNTASNSTQSAIVAVPSSTLTLEIANPAGTTLLVPGNDYTDTLSLAVDPNP
jgi:hypothetical protein